VVLVVLFFLVLVLEVLVLLLEVFVLLFLVLFLLLLLLLLFLLFFFLLLLFVVVLVVLLLVLFLLGLLLVRLFFLLLLLRRHQPVEKPVGCEEPGERSVPEVDRTKGRVCGCVFGTDFEHRASPCRRCGAAEGGVLIPTTEGESSEPTALYDRPRRA